MILCFLIVSYAAYLRIRFLDDSVIYFSWSKTIVSYFLVSHKLIATTVRRAIPLITSALDPEESLTEATHAWLLVVNLVGLRGITFFYKYLTGDFLTDNLIVSHDTPRFISCGEVTVLSYQTSSSRTPLQNFKGTSFLNLAHFHWAGPYQSRLNLG